VISLVRTKLLSHDYGSTAKHPTVLLFAGDNGVGKSKENVLIGEGLYKSTNGILYIRGTQYKEYDTAMKNLLRLLILDQLFKCPRSLVIIDEYELFHKYYRDLFLVFFRYFFTN